MLRAIKRVLKPGGRHAFFVIQLRDGLTSEEATRAIDVGREYLPAGPGYLALLEQAGYTDIVAEDVTDQYLATLHDWVREWRRARDELIDLHGESEFQDRVSRWTSAADLVEEGLLQRFFYASSVPENSEW